MPNPNAFVKLRPVGRLEKHATARHALDYYNNVATSAWYSHPKSDIPLQWLVQHALVAALTCHPSLSAIPVDEDKPAPYFVRLPQINLRDVVTFVDRKLAYYGHDEACDRELDELLEGQHNVNFKERYGELPFWRLVILHEANKTSQFVACFIYHHALADGTSGLAFHRTFLTALSTYPRVTSVGTAPHGDAKHSVEPDPIIYPPEKPLIPTLESLHPLPLSFLYLLKALWNDWFPRAPPTLWTALPITDSPLKRRSRFRSIALSQSTTARLISTSRANSTTLTGTVEAVLAAAVFANLPPEQYTVLRCDGAVSLRRWLPREVVSDDSIGTWVSRYVEEHHRPSNGPDRCSSHAMELFSWDEARRVRGTIEAELSKKGRNSVVGLLRYAGDMHSFFKQKMGKPREESFEFSNIGVFKPAQPSQAREGWEVGRVVFSQSADVVGAAFEASLVTGGDGCLNMGFSWLEGIVDAKWMEELMKMVKAMLEEVVQ